MKDALLLIDLQRDFLEATGRMPIATAQVEPLIDSVNRLVRMAEARGVEVITIGNEFKKGAWLNLFRNWAAVEGTTGAARDPRVIVPHGPYFAKDATSAFTNEAFARHVLGKRLWITGLMANACILGSVKSAIERGHEVFVIDRSVAARSEGARDRALAKMRRLGAKVVGPDAFLFDRDTAPAHTT